MSIRELDPGQRHTLASTPYRVQLTGAETGALLKAVDQAGHESETVRLTDREIVLTPEPRRLRLVAYPSGRRSFPASTMLGLTIRTEGGGPSEQVIVSRVDVGALESHELAVLDYAAERAVLTVSGSNGARPELRPSEDTWASGLVGRGGSDNELAANPSANGASGNSTSGQRAPGGAHSANHVWLRSGRYALRDAQKVGRPAPAVTSWGVVLDGSASMRAMHASGQLDLLLELTCGVLVAWTSEWPKVSLVSGVKAQRIPDATDDPTALARAAFGDTEPTSWAHFGEAFETVIGAVGDEGAALLITDGVPGDLARIADLAAAHRGVRLLLVTTGVSTRGLASDAHIEWWEEELAGVEPLDRLPNAAVVAIRTLPDGTLDLTGTRAAELALRLTGSQGLTGSPGAGVRA